jgi:type II secretory ATPase GspE/PulE/Tfp pilus assembly ATPase PilB-like protein
MLNGINNRKADADALSLSELGFGENQIESIKGMLAQSTSRRIILVSGQSGSGKSTTVKHLSEYLLACQPDLEISAVEYNPEYTIQGVTQIPVNNITDYGQIIHSVLHFDSDVVVVGEIRDEATASTVFRLAETGHTVITNITSRSPELAIKRLAHLAGYKPERVELRLLSSIHQELARENNKFVLTADVNTYIPTKQVDMDTSFQSDIQKVNDVMQRLGLSKGLRANDAACH